MHGSQRIAMHCSFLKEMKKKVFKLTIGLSIAVVLYACKTAQNTNQKQGVTVTDGVISQSQVSPNNDKSIVVLYDNDVHCNIDGYQHMAGYRDAVLDTAFCEMVSCGDYLQGGTAGAISKGQYIVDIMRDMGYTAVTLGNHEFDFKLKHMQELLPVINAPIICSNLKEIKTGKRLYDASYMKQVGNKKVAFVGVLTPTALYTEEAAFYDEKGNQVIELCEKNLYEEVQKSVDEVRKAGADYVIVVSHVGEDDNRCHARSHDLIKATNGIDVVLDGHTHSTVSQTRVRNKDGKAVLVSQTGTQFKHIGKLVIKADGTMHTELVKMQDIKQHANPRVAAVTDSIKQIFNAQVNRKVCDSEVPIAITNEAGTQIVRNQECAAGDLVTDAYRILTGADIALANGGGIRNSLKAGTFTYGDILSLLPYENYLCVVEATGQKIVELLNECVKFVPQENGDFPQASGITFTINVKQTPRIQDVKILDAKSKTFNDIDLNKTYSIATIDYCVTGGGLASVLKNAKIVKQNIMLYNEALIEYASKNLKGHIGKQYAQPAGRIKIIL